jgi:hypothetical protein
MFISEDLEFLKEFHSLVIIGRFSGAFQGFGFNLPSPFAVGEAPIWLKMIEDLEMKLKHTFSLSFWIKCEYCMSLDVKFSL